MVIRLLDPDMVEGHAIRIAEAATNHWL